MGRGGTAAAADEIDETCGGKIAQHGGHVGGCFIVTAEGIGQAGVRVAGGVAFGEGGEFLDVGPHRGAAEGAVDADGERPRVADAVVEGADGLAGQGAARGVGDRDGNHHGQAYTGFVKDALDGEQGGLGVERIEDGFDQQRVHAGGNQGAHLFRVGGDNLIPGHGAEVGPVDVGGHRERAVERSDGTRNEATPSGRGGGGLGRGAAGAGDGGGVQLRDQRLQMVVGLGDRGGVEGVGFNDVGAGGKVLGMNLFNHIRPGEDEQVVVALEVVWMAGETRAAEIRLGEVPALDHRAHRAIKHHDPLAEEGLKGGGGDVWHAANTGGFRGNGK